MSRLFVKRETTYNWQTRQDLYLFFTTRYGITREVIDAEIDAATANFTPRKWEPLNLQQLWQKVGKTLECRYTGSILRISNR